MKKSILIMLIAACSLISSVAAYAEPTVIMNIGTWPAEEDDFIKSDKKAPVSVIYKLGGYPSAESGRSAGPLYGFMFSVESSSCGNHCISPYFIALSDQYSKNEGAGIDYIYKIGNEKGKFRFALGLVEFNDPLNGGETTNLHAGVGFEAILTDKFGLILSIDHFSNGRKMLNREDEIDKNVPTNMLSVGFHFK